MGASFPNYISAYRVSPNNFRVDRRRVRKLIEDTMTAVEKRGVDFSDYDHMLIIPGVVTLPGRGYGMICYCGNPGMLTGVRRNPRFVTLRSRGGQSFSGGVFVGTENAPLGMFAHDFFHALGGCFRTNAWCPDCTISSVRLMLPGSTNGKNAPPTWAHGMSCPATTSISIGHRLDSPPLRGSG